MKLLDHQIYEKLLTIHHLLIEKRLWQTRPLDASRFSSLLESFSIWSFSARYLFKSQLPLLLRADEIISEANNEELFLEIVCVDSRTRYQDAQHKAYLKSAIPITYRAFYHPYRAFALNNIFAIRRQKVESNQLLNPEDFHILAEHNKKSAEHYLSSQIDTAISYSDQVVTLCIVCETLFHSLMYDGIYSINPPYVLGKSSKMFAEIEKGKNKLKILFDKIGLEKLIEFRDSLSIHIDRSDPNRTIHTIIRLLNQNERKRVKGTLGLSILFTEMAEALRRAIEFCFDIELEEEENLLKRGTFPSYKEETLGTSRIIDDWQSRNLYLRQKGFVYGQKTNVYVEGETEYYFLREEFKNITSINIINLKGNVVQKNGKGVSFRDSLRSDIDKHIFSIVMVDKDVQDNYRALKKSVEDNEFFGKYYLCNPDFEIENFTPDEMHQVFIEEKNIHSPLYEEFESEKNSIDSGKQFFKVISKLYPEARNYDKGETWGIALHHYSNSKSNVERLVDKLIQTTYRTLRWDYIDFTNRYDVSIDGELIEKRFNSD